MRTDRGLDRALFEVVEATDPAGLDAAATRMREHVLRDFRRSGVDQPDEVRARLREISERLTVLEQDFARIIRDDVRSIRVTADRLAGLPDDFVAGHPTDADGLVTVTTDYPDYMPFRTFASDADARRELRRRSSTAAGRPTTTCCTRCSTCATSGPACSATPAGPTTTPRSR